MVKDLSLWSSGPRFESARGYSYSKTKMRPSNYSKLVLFAIALFLAFYLYNLQFLQSIYSDLDQIGYLVAIISGMMFSFGLTLPLAIVSLMLLNPVSIALATFLALLGATISNLFIYHFYSDRFMSEFRIEKRNPILRRFDVEMKKGIFDRMKLYLSCTFAGVLMSIPISEKTETLILTGFREMETSTFILLSILLNAILIFSFILL